MNEATIDVLVALNERFYAAQAKSFSETRRSSWPGWERCLPYVQGAVRQQESQHQCRLLDVACGNLRFEAFLREQVPQVSFDVCAVDSCAPLAGEFAIAHPGASGNAGLARADVSASVDELVSSGCALEVDSAAFTCEPACIVPFDVRFCELDVIGTLRMGSAACGAICDLDAARCAIRDSAICDPATCDSDIYGSATCSSASLFDVAVAFGFLHHVPTAHLRVRLLRELVQSVRPGGYVIVSFWGFLRDDRLREKALLSHERALADLSLTPEEFDEGDFILGWQHERTAYRYCHNFTSRNVDELVREVSDCAQVEARFFADGRTGNLNEYLVLRHIAPR